MAQGSKVTTSSQPVKRQPSPWMRTAWRIARPSPGGGLARHREGAPHPFLRALQGLRRYQ